MPNKQVISTESAPQAIGAYSQAVKVGQTVYLSGQIPLDPATMEVVGADDVNQQIHQVFKNLRAVAEAAGGSLQDIVKLNIYLIDLECYADLNTIMAEYFEAPFPARAAVAVAALPKGVAVEMDGVLTLVG